MKLVVLILVLINALLLAYFNLARPQQATGNVSHEAIQPEKIKLLPPAEIEALPMKQADEPQAFQAVAFSCYEWGSFSAANLPRAREALPGLSLDATPIEKSVQEAARSWVFIPQSSSLHAAKAKTQLLRQRGVEERFVVFEPQWRYALSLGVFKDEQ